MGELPIFLLELAEERTSQPYRHFMGQIGLKVRCGPFEWGKLVWLDAPAGLICGGCLDVDFNAILFQAEVRALAAAVNRPSLLLEEGMQVELKCASIEPGSLELLHEISVGVMEVG